MDFCFPAPCKDAENSFLTIGIMMLQNDGFVFPFFFQVSPRWYFQPKISDAQSFSTI
jgi:hypothetical protein